VTRSSAAPDLGPRGKVPGLRSLSCTTNWLSDLLGVQRRGGCSRNCNRASSCNRKARCVGCRHDLHCQTQVRTASLPKNALGFTPLLRRRAVDRLCAGCGHDSITAAIVRRAGDCDRAAEHGELSGIFCSSKTPLLFREAASTAVNSFHCLMPSSAMCANAATARLHHGVRGDGIPVP